MHHDPDTHAHTHIFLTHAHCNHTHRCTLLPPSHTHSRTDVPVIVALLKFFNWRRIAIVTEDTSFANDMALKLVESYPGLAVTTRRVIKWSTINEGISSAVRALRATDSRIILIYGYSSFIRRFLCQAWKDGSLISSRHAWIMPGWFEQGWWKRQSGDPDTHSCSDEDMLEASHGILSTDREYETDSLAKMPSGKTAAEFRAAYTARAEAAGTTTSVYGRLVNHCTLSFMCVCIHKTPTLLTSILTPSLRLHPPLTLYPSPAQPHIRRFLDVRTRDA